MLYVMEDKRSPPRSAGGFHDTSMAPPDANIEDTSKGTLGMVKDRVLNEVATDSLFRLFFPAALVAVIFTVYTVFAARSLRSAGDANAGRSS